MIDFHCHLDLYPDPQSVADECRQRGLYVLSVTTTPTAWMGTNALSGSAPRIRTGLGLHPQLAHQRQHELALFDQLLPQVEYVGEIGLDGAPEYRRYWPVQIAVFEHILQGCAAVGGRTISVHSRRASSAVLDRIERFAEAGTFVLHWFSGSTRDLDRAAELGCWFSVGPAMLSGEKGRNLAARMPRDRVLTESDGPFAQFNGASLLPWQSQLAVEGLGRTWSLPPEAVEQMLFENLRRLVANLDP